MLSTSHVLTEPPNNLGRGSRHYHFIDEQTQQLRENHLLKATVSNWQDMNLRLAASETALGLNHSSRPSLARITTPSLLPA